MTYLNALMRLTALSLLIFTSAASADVLDDILERGTVRIGVSEFAPWTMKSESGELIGFEIDIANRLAEDMGVKLEIKAYKWHDIISALQNGEIDVLAGGMAITAERALQVNFTNMLATSGISIATNTELTIDVASLEELNQPEIKVVVTEDTLAANVADSLFAGATITRYESGALAEQEMIDGRAHVYVASVSEANFLALRYHDQIDVPMPEPIIATVEGLAVRKGEQELLNFLNAWIAARHADKWLASTHDYWFESLEWAEDVKD